MHGASTRRISSVREVRDQLARSCRSRRWRRRPTEQSVLESRPFRTRPSGSDAGNGEARGLMDDPASGSRALVSELALAAVGVVALSAERIDALAEAIAARGNITTVDEARELLRDQVERWREGAAGVGGQAASRASALARDLGLMTREEADELELRVAQLERRLHLLERASDSA